ncbi:MULTISPECIES: hypothetical protein [unclassified Duganella]|uniref:hypothetical protein n=1 Tax=unclassified Duganella TaxID=2636909 RepID=UPI0008916EB9|nr:MULTISPECIES: hypothetical protein [unclassified Duganella]SDF80338.1 hypothetical protein SAMN05216320_1011372 [Duganella sp. OV458]SDI48877.1 hypothetical protein SAMN05428973_10143 [Duganella sp. OV510]
MSLAAEAQPGAPAFLDTLIANLKLKNDADLARAFEVAPPVISKIRHRKLPFGDSMILKAHEKFNFAVADIRAGLAGKAT